MKVVELFFVYAFLGWCVEVSFAGLKDGKFVNRGFLLGPWCPMYGVGAVLLIYAAEMLTRNVFGVFLISMTIATIVELITGWLLKVLFHQRWWDYSDMPLNIGGYICPLFSVAWGLGGVFLTEILDKPIKFAIEHQPHLISLVIIGIVGTVFAADVVLTLLSLAKLNIHAKEVEELRSAIKDLSDRIGEKVYRDSVSAAESPIGQRAKDDMEVLKALHEQILKEREEVLRKRKVVLGRFSLFEKRLLRQYAKARSTRYKEAFRDLKEAASKLKN